MMGDNLSSPFGGCVRPLQRPRLAALLGCEGSRNRWASDYAQVHYMANGTVEATATRFEDVVAATLNDPFAFIRTIPFALVEGLLQGQSGPELYEALQLDGKKLPKADSEGRICHVLQIVRGWPMKDEGIAVLSEALQAQAAAGLHGELAEIGPVQLQP